MNSIISVHGAHVVVSSRDSVGTGDDRFSLLSTLGIRLSELLWI